MTMTVQSFIGSGDLYLDRLTDAGVSTGFEKVGNATKFEIKADSDMKEQQSKGRDTYGQVIATVVIPKPASISISLDQLDRKSLAMVFLGEDIDINQTSSRVTNELVTSISGKHVQLDNAGLGATSIVVTDTASIATSFTEGVDFEMNLRLGTIKAIVGGAITDGTELKVSYNKAAITGSRITGVTKPSIKVALMLDGLNFVNGLPCIVRCYQAQLTPKSAVDFLASDFLKVDLDGRLITPTGHDYPYTVEMLDA